MVREKRARHDRGRIGETQHIKSMRCEPLGSPVSVTREEAAAIVAAAFGKRPDLPAGADYVRRLRPIWKGLLKKQHG